ncbi:MAG: hypothetical protein K8R53_11715, partial [Bacteroidales bacterium]|nr:hypothetical protein [Bacteroidales bacterium]
MKRILLVLIIISSLTGFAQTPDLINYQMIVRDSTGQIRSNEQMTVIASIIKDFLSNPEIVYQEEHDVTTNDYGLVNIKIGNGTIISGEFGAIDWNNGDYYLQPAINLGTVANFAMGTSQLVSVPYALNAREAESANGLILTDPNGNQYEVVVDTLGNIITLPIINGEAIGWTHERMDIEGSSHYPFGSSILSNQIEEQWSFNFNPSHTPRTILTGNVVGDEKLEIVTVQDNRLYVYDAFGAQLDDQDISISGQSDSKVTMLEDTDNDGLLDIGVNYGRGNWNYGELKARIYDGSGALDKEFTKNVNADGWLMPLTMMEGDIIIVEGAGFAKDPRGFSRWDYSTGDEIWYYDVGPAYSSYSIADINNDGLKELAYGNYTVHNYATGHGTSDYDTWTIIVNESGDSLLSQKYSSGNASDGGLHDMFIKFSNTY